MSVAIEVAVIVKIMKQIVNITRLWEPQKLLIFFVFVSKYM